jgi:hypothetical protein
MKKTFSRRHWIANGVASIVFLLCAVVVIYYTPFEPKTRIGLVALAIVLLLMCFYFWQLHESGKEKMHYWVWVIVFGVVWTLVGFGVGALIYNASYLGLLTLQSAAWKSLGWMGPLAVGPFLVVLGLVSIMRKGILNLLNN